MTFKEWYANKEQHTDCEVTPVIVIQGETTIEKVVHELERLGFERGNDFSAFGAISHIDIWYADFYNLFMIYAPHPTDILTTLAELKEVQNGSVD